MCTSANALLISEVIDEMVNAGKCFTAYDVTKEAKTRGANENHYHMKGSVHSRYSDLQNLGYDRSLVQSPTGNTFLYHPTGADIQAEIDRINGNASASTVLPSPNAPQSSNVATLSSNTTTVTTAKTKKNQPVDAEGRLPIYAPFISALGLKTGDMVAVYSQDGVLTDTYLSVEKYDASATSTPVATYTVNLDGRIRIGEEILSTFLPSSNGVYVVSIEKNEIQVKSN